MNKIDDSQKKINNGIDSIKTVAQAEESAYSIAHEYNTIVAVTGEKDFVTDGQKGCYIFGGSKFFPYITAMGCSLSSLIGAFIGISPNRIYESTISALVLFSVAGSCVSKSIKGPGTFLPHFLDNLYCLNAHTIQQNMKIQQK